MTIPFTFEERIGHSIGNIFAVLGEIMTKEQLRVLVSDLKQSELKTVRAIINGMLSKRAITKDQQDKMQQARKRKSLRSKTA